MPVPLSLMMSSLVDSAVTMTNASSNVCTSTYFTTLLITLVIPDISHRSFSDLG